MYSKENILFVCLANNLRQSPFSCSIEPKFMDIYWKKAVIALFYLQCQRGGRVDVELEEEQWRKRHDELEQEY